MRKRTPPHSMTCRSPVTRFSMDLMQEIGSADVVLEGASFVLRDPDADKITGQVVALRQRMQGLARNVFLGDLTLEFDAVGVVLGHGFHPWKPGKFRSISNLQSVHPLGCTPFVGSKPTGLTPAFQSTSVPGSVAKRKMAGADVGLLSASTPETMNPGVEPGKVVILKAVSVGAPLLPKRSTGGGILTTIDEPPASIIITRFSP